MREVVMRIFIQQDSNLFIDFESKSFFNYFLCDVNQANVRKMTNSVFGSRTIRELTQCTLEEPINMK